MEKPARRQQTTERIGPPLDTGVGRVYIERRNNSAILSARAFIKGRYKIWSTGERTEKDARRVAVPQYMDLFKRSQKEQIHGRLFSDVADAFLKWATEHKRGEISDGQIEQYGIKWNVLKPYFDNVKITDVDHKFLVDLREKRAVKKTQFGKPTKPTTLQKDLVFVRLVLKYGKREEKCITEIPDFPMFRGAKFKIADEPTPYLTLAEYNKLVKKAEERMKEKGLNPRVKRQREELYAFIMICVGAALRVGEAHSIRWMDCTRVKLNNPEKQPAIRMMVKGKNFKWTGKRQKSWALYQGLTGFKLLQDARPEAKPEDPLFLETHRQGMTDLLEAANLRVVQTEHGEQLRTAKSLRHTGISLMLHLSKNPDVYKISKWSRTSIEQVRSFYDQNPAESAVGDIAAFRKPKGKKKDEEPEELDEIQEEPDDEL